MAQVVLGPSMAQDQKKSPTVHLLPFHISYSGPAAISRYFRIRRASPPSSVVDSRTLPTPQDSQEEEDGNAPPPVEETYEATFRGRLLHGKQIALPEGYSGLVLHASTRRGGEDRAFDRRKRRRTMDMARITRQRVNPGEDHGLEDRESLAYEEREEEDYEELELSSKRERDRRLLTPTSTFDSFVLWNPDGPMDQGDDAYLRGLREWTTLASIVGLFTSLLYVEQVTDYLHQIHT
jgi:hypothetical protein